MSFTEYTVAKQIYRINLDEDTALLKKMCCDMLGLSQRGHTDRLIFIDSIKESEDGIDENSRAS